MGSLTSILLMFHIFIECGTSKSLQNNNKQKIKQIVVKKNHDIKAIDITISFVFIPSFSTEVKKSFVCCNIIIRI